MPETLGDDALTRQAVRTVVTAALARHRAFAAPGLGPTARLVLLALVEETGGEGACRLTMTALGQRCGVDRRTVQRLLPRLVERGHVSVTRSVGGPGALHTFDVHPGGRLHG